MTKMIPPAPTSAVMMPTPKQKIGFSIESIVGNDAAPSTNSTTQTTTTATHTTTPSSPPQTNFNNLTMSPTSPTTQLHHHIGHLHHHLQHHHHLSHPFQNHQTSPKSGDINNSTSPLPHPNQRPQDIQDIINRLQNTANNLASNNISNNNNNNNSFSSYSPPMHHTRLSPEVSSLALHLKRERERSPPSSSHGNLTPPISTSPSPSSNTTPNPINLNCSSNNPNNSSISNSSRHNFHSNNNHSANLSPASSPNNLNINHMRDSHSPLLSASTTTSGQQSQHSPGSGMPTAAQIHSQFGGMGKGPIVVPGMPAGLIRPFPTVAGGPPNAPHGHSPGQPPQPDIKALPPYINSPDMVPPQHHNPHLLAAAQFQMAAALQAGHVLGAAAAGLPPHSPFLQNHPAIPRDSYPLYPWLLSRHGRIFPHRFPGNFLLQPFRKPKRIRTAFSPSQLLKLEHAFESNQYVVGAERKALAQSLNLSETQVKVWFQNRRTKHKRMQQEDEKGDGKGGSGNDRLNSCDDSDDELIDMEMDDCPSDDELEASH